MIRWLGYLLLVLMVSTAALAENPPAKPKTPVRIALIIDDLGNQQASGEQALSLPGAVTYSFLPQTPYAWRQASKAHRLHKEVMLHLPMESDLGSPLGAGALTLGMPQAKFIETLNRDLASVPYAAGINNHMGSLLTRDPTAMRWLMTSLRDAELFFIDSRTTNATVAEKVAQANLIPSARRHVFLDNQQDMTSVRRQLEDLIETARRQGGAIGIGHPYPETLAVLAEELPKLKAEGIELVPASELTNQGSELWHASSYPLLKGVKSSKQSPSPIY